MDRSVYIAYIAIEEIKSNFYSFHIPDEPSRTGDIAIYVLTFVEKNGIDNSSTHPLPSPLVL